MHLTLRSLRDEALPKLRVGFLSLGRSNGVYLPTAMHRSPMGRVHAVSNSAGNWVIPSTSIAYAKRVRTERATGGFAGFPQTVQSGKPFLDWLKMVGPDLILSDAETPHG